MKHFLLAVLATLSLTAQAQKETQTLVYSWTAADTAAGFYRTLAEESNKIQNKYTFTFFPTPIISFNWRRNKYYDKLL